MPHLVFLRVLKAVTGILEIRTRVLTLGIEEKVIEIVAQIVVMCYVPPCPGYRVVHRQPSHRHAHAMVCPPQPMRRSLVGISQAKRKKLVEISCFHAERAIHPRFSNGKVGI